MLVAPAERQDLKTAILERAVRHGEMALSSGATTKWYADMRRLTLDGAYAPLIGRLMLDLTSSLEFDAVGGLTLGADPVATAMMHQAAALGRHLTCFVVRQQVKAHGTRSLIEGPDVSGRRVLVVDDTSTTGASLVTPMLAVNRAGAIIAGAAVVLDRGAGAAAAVSAHVEPFLAAISATELGLV